MNKILIILFLFFSLKGFSQNRQNDIAFASSKNTYHTSVTSHESFFRSLSATIEEWMLNKKPAKAVLGYTKQNRPVQAFYFPGSSNKKALVIGGMHGSELPSVEIARQLIDFLSGGSLPYYNVVIIPVLFPDNAEKATANVKHLQDNTGRYTTEESVDPNRQMPELGKSFRQDDPVDMRGRIIEMENQYLLQLIQEYEPTRIVNLHAIKDVTKAGIYADPRTDCNGYALGYETDSSLAISVASFIEKHGGKVPGNHLQKTPTTLYYTDPEIASTGLVQKRNINGSPIPYNRGRGVSLGGWASTAVCDESRPRNAARLITIEFPGYLPARAYEGRAQRNCILNEELYALAIREIFLSEKWTE
jgi:hypothetical protein